jgi:hypothetical protein
MQAAVVLEGDLNDPIGVMRRRPDEGMQEDLDGVPDLAGICAIVRLFLIRTMDHSQQGVFQ